MEILLTFVPFIFGLLALYLFFKLRISKIKNIAPNDAVLFDYVRWGQVGKLAVLKMGVLALYPKEIVLIDSTRNEVFRMPVKEVKILYTSTRLGMDVSHADKQFDVRIDYGSLPAYFRVNNRYDLWAEKIAEFGGKNFLIDQHPVGKVFFNTSFNRIYGAVIIVLFIVMITYMVVRN